jgi:glycosyltransferase involved in cell wall biosynthesis
MLKAADALAAAGYQVRMVSTRNVDWATAADADARRARAGAWEWTVVDYHRRDGRGTHHWSRLRWHAARALTRAARPGRAPLGLAARAYGRMHPELWRAARARPADLFYGGTNGALAATALAGRHGGVPYALDLEDFHSGESGDDGGPSWSRPLAERIERAVLPDAAFLTAGSAAIASAYAAKYGVRPIPINNTFRLPLTEPDLTPSAGEGLKLYWFSQTLGPGRGLEDAVEAMAMAAIPGELHCRGAAIPEYLEHLRRLTARAAPRLRLVHHDPAPPDAMVELCHGFDVGLALERLDPPSRSLCLTNKAFTYILAGLAVVLSDTPGQRPLAVDLGEGALLYAPADTAALAAGLARWAKDKSALIRARRAAWEGARRRWHWEHPLESGALVAAVGRALGH